MGQPEAAQSCQWWEALVFQAEPQAWVWLGVGGVMPPGVQMAFKVTSRAGILKLRSGLFRLSSVRSPASQAAKVFPALTPARTVTPAPSL